MKTLAGERVSGNGATTRNVDFQSKK